MNKLLGFYELKQSGLPTVRWEEFDNSVRLDDSRLWTIRSAVYQGEDLNLPRKVGVGAQEAWEFASGLADKLGTGGLVLYYPYFIAEKSGTLEVKSDEIIIEAVKDDLWNMVTYSDRAVTLRYAGGTVRVNGDSGFLQQEETEAILANVALVRRLFRDDILGGSSILLEWSFAYDCDASRKVTGEKYLVFYEARTV
ncbi:MAG: hypothetical protein NC124_03630 [Clostridium sp.]|nr:hypothetical protein [Clostridium sp.]